MALPVTFATLPAGNTPASLIDTQFAAVAAMGTIYCTALGSNAVTLTPAPNQPTVSAYSAGMTIAWIQPTTNTGAVTVSVSGLGAVNLTTYKTPTGVNALLTGGELPGGQLVLATFDGTQFQALWVAVLPLTGGTLTGNLVINGPPGNNRQFIGQTSGSNRWNMLLGDSTAESGSNAGSNFGLYNYSDAGATIGSSLAIERKTGYVTLNAIGATLTAATSVTSTSASLRFNAATGGASQFIGQVNGLVRWLMYLGNGGTESGGNVASDFQLIRCSDAGVAIDMPLSINRASGAVAVRGTQTNDSAAAGFVGEFLQATGSSTGISNGVAATVSGTQLTLTAGDWEVWGTALLSPSAGFSSANLGIGTTVNVLPTSLLLTSFNYSSAIMGPTVLTTPTTRFSVAASQNVFLTAQVNFASGTATAIGNSYARRRR